jgi:ABC-2 type transport system permease protein
MLTALYILSILLMIVLPVIFAGLLRRRFPTPWLMFCAGILTFTGSQVIHIPLNNWLADLGILPQGGFTGEMPLWRTALILGLSAGLCEELARTAGYAILRRYRQLGDSLMLGLGHGGIESMVFGGIQTAAAVGILLPLTKIDLSTLGLSTSQLATLEGQITLMLSSPSLAFAPMVERLLAIGIHLTLSVIVLRAFQKRNAWYVIFAILYHALIDFTAVYASQYIHNAWALEGMLALGLLPGFIWLAWTIRREGKIPSHSVTSLGREAAVFWTALRKELLQQWRTRRVIIVLAVFGLFGMFSPLIAYFIPQMLSMIPGAEMFSEMVPEPTAADAMQQYVKNLTQFGFILALLLGMSAVAGEKEHGTAALVLSKPMPRWAFISSKLTTQVLLYIPGFLLAWMGGYIYTVVLFGELDFPRFALLNVVLLFWLLPYAAITLLGSTIGNSTTSAAGISLVGVILLLLSSSIPQIGQVMPGALAGWADLLGSQAAGGLLAFGQQSIQNTSAATGAMAASIVITLVCLVTSIAIFEQQEL